MDKFEVVAMVLAPEQHIATFIAHYRRRGADRVRVFFDGDMAPEGPFEGGEIVVCDEAFWRSLGQPRPQGVENRQRAVYNHAYRQSVSDWVLVVDVDEFILGDDAIGELLSRVEPERESVIFRPVEAAYSSRSELSQEYGAAYFRKPYGRPYCSILPHLVYPGSGGCFTKGLLGHDMGKHAVRTGIADIVIDIHESKRDGKPLEAARNVPGASGRPLFLAHYDAISLEHWRAKWDRRLAARDLMEVGRKRNRQFELYAAARQRGTETELFRRLYTLGAIQTFLLRCLNLIIPHKPNDLTV